MLAVLRLLTRLREMLLAAPFRAGRATIGFISMPHLGRLRFLVHLTLGYVVFAFLLVYVVAPLRGVIGGHLLGDKLRYDAERWLATAIYDRAGNFVGTFDPRLDSVRDVNYTDAPIEVGEYTANPDHKSIDRKSVV